MPRLQKSAQASDSASLPPAATQGPATVDNNKPSLSLSRLREAFAAMLKPAPQSTRSGGKESATSRPAPVQIDPCEISPRTVVEAILFVGRPDNRPFTTRELAATMRGVSPAEIDDAIAQLNKRYEHDGAPYQIVGSAGAYQLVLRDDYRRMRDKLQGRARESKLSPAALEVLSIVAYNQPTTLDEINEMRGASSGALLATLVRRQLIRLDRPESPDRKAVYQTTERFLRLFGLDSLAALPRSEDLEKA